MNVTAEEFESYLQKFHSTLRSTAQEHLPPELVGSLLHLSIFPATIRGYVSTRYGVAWEYLTARSPSVAVELGSRRVDDLLLDRPMRFARQFADRGPVFNIHNARNIELHTVWIKNEPVPFRLGGTETHLTLINCNFDALGWAKQISAAEIFGNREASFWSPDLAIGCAKDEVLAALTERNRSASLNVPMVEYINAQKQKTVLVLGDYSDEGTARLAAIRRCLESLGYNPFLVKDVPEIFGADIRQKAAILGGLSRLVVVDDSSPSGHLAEVMLAQQNDWTTVLLHANGRRGSWMTAGIGISRSNFHEEDYDPSDPYTGVERASKWAESRIGGLEREYKHTFPWRT